MALLESTTMRAHGAMGICKVISLQFEFIKFNELDQLSTEECGESLEESDGAILCVLRQNQVSEQPEFLSTKLLGQIAFSLKMFQCFSLKSTGTSSLPVWKVSNGLTSSNAV